MYRDHTKVIKIGNRVIGGGNPILIQSMTNTKTEDVEQRLRRSFHWKKQAVILSAAQFLLWKLRRLYPRSKKQIHIPLVADIHFDYRLAIAAMENGADKIRINPGNIGSKERIQAVVDTAKERNIPIRVGVNSGSLEKELVEKYHGVTAEGLVESALDKVHIIEEMGYDNLVISIKSSDVLMCARAHELIAEKTQYPLHVGITEAGTLYSGNIKISYRTWDHPVSGNRRYHPCFSDRRAAGRSEISQKDPENAGTSQRRRGGCFLSDLRKNKNRSDRPCKPGRDHGTGYSFLISRLRLWAVW